ncbi:MAG: 5,10-methylenetetrahydrofolate reductase [Brachybacterium sp.]|nr:5,10-methylenetetrahydrofolate reductase [Brachybacterium sp.]
MTKNAALIALLEGARYEVLPTANIVGKVAGAIPSGRTVTVTASPDKGLEATLATSEQLAGEGYRVVPHLAARMVSGPTELEEITGRLDVAGIRDLFVPAGDADPAAGPYSDSLSLLQELEGMDHPFTRVGIAGYPESHPQIPDEQIERALVDKLPYATEIVSNMCLDPALVVRWIGGLSRRDVQLPVLVGMPGPIAGHKLLAIARRIGVTGSAKFLAKNTRLFGRLLRPGGYRPERFLGRLGGTAAASGSLLQGVHLYTFNQVAETESWRSSQLEKLRQKR